MQNYIVPERTRCFYCVVQKDLHSSTYLIQPTSLVYHSGREPCVACFMRVARENKLHISTTYYYFARGTYEDHLLCALELSILTRYENGLILSNIHFGSFEWEEFDFQLLIRHGDNAAYRSMSFRNTQRNKSAYYSTLPVNVDSKSHISSARRRGNFQWNQLSLDLKLRIAEYLDCLSLYTLCIAENVQIGYYKNKCPRNPKGYVYNYGIERISKWGITMDLDLCFCQTQIYTRKIQWDEFCIYSSMSRDLCAVDSVDTSGKCLVYHLVSTLAVS